MATNRQGLTLIDSSTRYPFTIFKDPKSPSRPYSIKPRDWETGDPIGYWKQALHPFDGGLGTDKIVAPKSYAAANADLSNPGIIVPPPLLQVATDSYREIKCVDSNGMSANGTAATSIDVDIEGGLSVGNLRPGDIIVGFVVCVDADAKTIANSVGGMTALTQVDNNNFSIRAFYKIYTGTPVALYTFTFGATIDTFEVSFAAFRGASAVRTSSTATDSTAPYTTPSITAVAGDTVIGIVARSAGTITGVPSGWTEILTATHTDGYSWAYKNNLSAGALTGDFTAGASTDGGVISIILTHATPAFANETAPNPSYRTGAKYVNFNSKSWTFDETGLYSLGSSMRLVRELYSTGITDIAVFNNELIIAYGYATKISKMTAATPEVFTTASDNTYAKRLAVVGANLWRSTAANAVSSCLSTPLTLSNWGASYTVGDTTYDINILIDYGGSLWVGKPDGIFTPDVNTDFWNQAPQLIQWPDTNNCFGAFVAKGYLWLPTIQGLIRIRAGEALISGPELAKKRSVFFQVTAGVEWGDAIYLSVYDKASAKHSIIKMVQDVFNYALGYNYIYHEILRVDTSGSFWGMGININTGSTPCLAINSYGTGIVYIDLGYSTGRYIDDNNWFYGTAYSFETGSIKPTDDLSVVTGLLGIEIVTDHNASESLDTIQYKVEEGSYANLLTTQEGGGTMAITNTSGFNTYTRYAPAGTLGNYFSFYFAGSLPAQQHGTDRPEIREIYAFGYRRSKVTDVIAVKIYADSKAIVNNGIPIGLSSGEIFRLFRNWKNSQTVLQMELPDYEESRTIRVRIVAADYEELNAVTGTTGVTRQTGVITLTMVRDDMAGAYAS